MTDKGLQKLEENMKQNKDAKLLFNGKIASRFLKEEKELANKHHIPYTVVTNEEVETDIGAVLAYDHAIDKENIFYEEEVENKETREKDKNDSFFNKLKRLF